MLNTVRTHIIYLRRRFYSVTDIFTALNIFSIRIECAIPDDVIIFFPVYNPNAYNHNTLRNRPKHDFALEQCWMTMGKRV